MSEFHVQIYAALRTSSEEVLHYYLLHLDDEAKNVLVHCASEDKDISPQRFAFICDMARTPRTEHLEMVITRAQIFKYPLTDNWFKPLLPFQDDEWAYLCHEYDKGLLNGFIPEEHYIKYNEIGFWYKKLDEWKQSDIINAPVALKKYLLSIAPVKLARLFDYTGWDHFLAALALPVILKDWYLHINTPERVSFMYLERNCPSLLFLEVWAGWKQKIGLDGRYYHLLSKDLEPHVKMISQHVDVFANPVDGDLHECQILL